MSASSSSSSTSEKEAGDPVEPCPYAQAQECVLEVVEVKCSHGKRGYDMKLPLKGEPLKKNPHKVLEVIAGETKGDEITATLKMKKPLCPDHKEEAFDLSPEVEGTKISGTTLKFPARCGKVDGILQSMWLPGLKPVEYTVSPSVCDMPDDVAFIVRAYPDISWEVGWAINLQDLQAPGKKKYAENDIERLDWGFELKTLRKYDGEEKDYSKKVESAVKKVIDFLEVGQSASKVVLKCIQAITGTALEPELPKLSMDFTAAMVEIEKDYTVDTQLKLDFVADPLLGLSFSYDILDGLCKLCGPAAPVLLSAKKLGNAKVEFKVGAVLKGEFHWEKKLKGSWTCKGQFGPEIPITLTASVEPGCETLAVGMKGEAATAFGAAAVPKADDTGLYISGKLYWTGLTLTGVVYIRVKSRIYNKEKEKKAEWKVFEEKEWETSNAYLIRNEN